MSLWKRFSLWSAFFRPERQQAAPPPPRPPRPPQTAPLPALRVSLTTLEGLLLLVACQLPPDWRVIYAQELGRVLNQRRRHGYLRLPPPRMPLSYERFGNNGELLQPFDTLAVCARLRRETEAIVRLLETPEEELCSTRRTCLLARRAARLGQLVDELAKPRRGVDTWQELFLALLAVPGAQGLGMPTRPRSPRRVKVS